LLEGTMRHCAILAFLAGCSDYGFHFGLGLGKDRDDAGDGFVDGGDGGGGGGSGGLPGETLPPDWPDWDDSCAARGTPGINVDHFTITEPVDRIEALVTVGNLTYVPTDGPIVVDVSGVRGAGTAEVVNGVLTLDYIGMYGNMTIHGPVDLAEYDLRLCVGNIVFSELGGSVAAEARTGNIDGDQLVAEVVYTTNPVGNVTLQYDTAPAELWMDGGIGNHVAEVPIDDCDCDLDVGVGFARLTGIDDDPGAQTSVWARRNQGNISVHR
jgi:hypothetical protein